MSKARQTPPSRHRNDRRRNQRRRRPSRGSLIGAAVLATLAVAAAGVLAVRATGTARGARGPHITLYQGQAALGGDQVTLASLLGRGEPLVVNFWASNCPPCRMEMPGFQQVYAEHGGHGYLMLGVDVGPQTGLGTHAGARALIASESIAYPVGYAEGNDLLVKYGLRGMPTTLFFDASGHQVGRVVGYLDEAQLRARLGALLASSN